ncbi:unnamed protein product [Echinostoma caproni]|uniref:Heat shock cognate 71 kDa protein n=1 Tax=Echinostoma caproni TaxID=27848 RepID=A0A183A950_9TREM|nr:unnamed protein product [Echinostoma caproni]
MVVIFPRNTQVPDSKTMLIEGSQSRELSIRLYEGEDPLVENNYFLGEACISIPPPYTNITEVTFCVDQNTNISLYTIDKATGQRIDVKIHDARNQLCRQDIDYIIQNCKRNLAADKNETERIEERNRLRVDVQRMMHEAQKLLHDRKNDLHFIETQCDIALHWIKQCPNSSLKKYKEIRSELKKMFHKFGIFFESGTA